ncbi:RluA family pseudouridine synthase [Brumimicrobium aurantiacum]|uniref:RluA family pseudouridine synthase n=1 Tax=Brumimicrobium aurantiacum TaxID=1737063 RepID=A0A3E1EZN5_9FLAO|nr:RluA family pseudouridine synthase [Brumimicrobium aurantiacum]RFC54943.1 RluA family pseudouridine synthase [Brumimicrobium aurantiacum]
MQNPSKFISFLSDISEYSLPEKFTYPFYYTPHPLAEIAAKELQDYISSQEWDHNFGLNPKDEGLEIGKMFGVLVVQNDQNEIGYLAAFSGKLANSNHHQNFVPPVFDMLTEGSFFLEGELEINAINERIAELEKEQEFLDLKLKFQKLQEQLKTQEESLRSEMREAKAARKKKRTAGKSSLSPTLFEELKTELANESIAYKNKLAKFKTASQEKLQQLKNEIAPFQDEFDQLLLKRKTDSAKLQQRLFKAYKFLNIDGDQEALLDIFSGTAFKRPPAGAGECAAPKLLQYAFKNDLKPVALAEFWWGAPPGTEVRKHQHFYPACLGKCKPILSHMLDGIPVDENPLLKNPGIDKVIETVFEDDKILVINKPHDLLSVPGKEIYDSVFSRIKKEYPDAEGPLIVHRLDMSTSGLMIIAKDLTTNHHLQQQFIKRTVAKTYTALLVGYLKETSGVIDLPLALDVLDRPRQKVDFENGKSARTEWEVLERRKGTTRIKLIPITGRTHQLRVHCAHSKGLDTPIKGDDLYGQVDNRLHLHATTLEITHPETKERLRFEAEAGF